MGLFDLFKKKSQESEEAAAEAASDLTEAAEKQQEASDANVNEQEVPTSEQETEAAAVQPTEENKTIQLNQELAQGIFNESLALYRSMPQQEREIELHGALVTLTNDPLSKTFLEAASQGMVTPERIANNIKKADERSCRLALVQLASEGENRTKEERAMLGQTQTALFLRILELNHSAGTSETAKPVKVAAPEGETPVAFFQLEVQIKATEKKLNEAQGKLSETGIALNQYQEKAKKKIEEDKEAQNEPKVASPDEVEAALADEPDYQELKRKEAEDRQAFDLLRKQYLALADQLAKEILNLPVLFAAVDSLVRPEMPWISNNGHTEFYTSKTVAAQVEEGFKKQGITNMTIKELKGEEIRSYMEKVQHLGIVHFLLDNGRTPIDLRCSRVVDFEEKSLPEYANRAIRFGFLRAKSYGVQYSALDQAAQAAEEGLNLRDRLLTMLFNAYRELGMGISYTLMQAKHQDDTTWYSPKAYEIATTLQKGVFKRLELTAPGDKKAEVYQEELSLALIKRGKASDPKSLENAPSLIPIFSDIQSARTLQANLALQHARYEIVAITWDEIRACATNVPGIIYDPELYGLYIPQEDFEKVEQFRRVRGSIVIDHHKK